MKKILNLTAVIAVITAFALSSCGKYEDGPGMSLASKKSRLVGVWQIEKEIYTVGGVTTEVTSNPDWANMSVEFTKDGVVKSTYIMQGASFSVEGTWEFDSSKENIITTYTSGGVSTTSTTKILCLKAKELWMEDTESNGDKSEVHYKAK